MKIFAIVNPIAGGGYAGEIYRSVLKEFEKFDLEFHLTSGPGNATELAKAALENGFTHLVCIGGDGTLNEIVQSIAKSPIILVPISAGTGSDFVKSTNIRDIPSVVEAMNNNTSRSIDLGKVTRNGETRYFLNILEVGFGAQVMKRVNSRRKSHDGRSFTSAVLATIPSYRPYEISITHENGSESMKVAEIIIANGRYFGGGMLAAPNADLDDGLLDVHIVKGAGKLQLLTKLRKLKDGRHINDPVVSSMRSSSLKLKGKAPVEIDGEDFGELPIEVGVENNAIRLIN